MFATLYIWKWESTDISCGFFLSKLCPSGILHRSTYKKWPSPLTKAVVTAARPAHLSRGLSICCSLCSSLWLVCATLLDSHTQSTAISQADSGVIGRDIPSTKWGVMFEWESREWAVHLINILLWKWLLLPGTSSYIQRLTSKYLDDSHPTHNMLDIFPGLTCWVLWKNVVCIDFSKIIAPNDNQNLSSSPDICEHVPYARCCERWENEPLFILPSRSLLLGRWTRILNWNVQEMQ